MGKRKKSSRKPMGPKKKEVLPTVFSCLFCNHERCVSVKLNKKDGTGDLACNVCGQTFQCHINYLSEPVDVYSEWVDAADAVAKGNHDLERATGGGARPGGSRPGAARRPADEEPEDMQYEGEGIVADDEDYD